MTPEEAKKKYPLFQRFCQLCGCPLAFGLTSEGKKIPMDLHAPVYCVTGEQNPGQPPQVVRTELCFVSHFATCPEADKFHGDKKL